MVCQTPVGINDLVIRPTANEIKICASWNAFVFDQIFMDIHRKFNQRSEQS